MYYATYAVREVEENRCATHRRSERASVADAQEDVGLHFRKTLFM